MKKDGTRVRTTVYLDAPEYRRLKEIADRKGSTAAEEIREAIAEYIADEKPKALPRSLGAGSSQAGDLSERAEELLGNFGRR
jgi:predicted transcriptional regulator